MDLKGKYLTIKVDDDNARVFFDLPRESGKAGKQWMFGGRIEGETPGVGVWMMIEEVTTNGREAYRKPGGDAAGGATRLRRDAPRRDALE